MSSAIDDIHDLIHALRKVVGYKPTEFEKEVNEIIAETYASECAECKYKKEELKMNKFKLSANKGFLGGLFK